MENNQVDYLNMFIIIFFSVLPLAHHIVEASRGIEHVWTHAGRKGKFQLYKGESIVGDTVHVGNSVLKSATEVLNVYQSSRDREHMIESETNICPGDGCVVRPLFWYSAGQNASLFWIVLSFVVMVPGSTIKVGSNKGDSMYHRHCYLSLFLSLFFLQVYQGEHQYSTIHKLKIAFMQRLGAMGGNVATVVDDLGSGSAQAIGSDLQR